MHRDFLRTHRGLRGYLARALGRLGPTWSASPERRLVQSVCLFIFMALFFWVCWPYGTREYAKTFAAREIVNGELFLILDPLVSVSAAVAARMFVWSLAVAAGVILVGVLLPRAFCGYVCPLGTLIDVFDWLLGKAGRPSAFGQRGWWSGVRYYLLAVVLIAAGSGVLLSGFVAAIPVLTRAMLFVAAPFQMGLAKGWYLVPPANVGHVISIALLMLVFCLGLLGQRFWCNHLCPTGALLSVCALLRLTERRVTRACVECGRCVKVCSFAAINDDFATRPLSCTSCRTCAGVCPTKAIEFPWRRKRENGGANDDRVEDQTIRSRRNVLAGLGGAVVAGLGASLAAGGACTSAEAPIRPPGSVPEDKFLQLCVRCGQCIKVCPNNVLQPAGLEYGFNGLWTPEVVPDWSGCEPSCNNCGQVCPTGAVRALDIEEKRVARIGLAEVDRITCLPHAGREACQLCVDECRMAGYNAIEFVRVGGRVDEMGEPLEDSGYLAPVVRQDRCVGCGLCQMRCRGINVKSRRLLQRSAIRVFAGAGKEDRIVSGSYRALREGREGLRPEHQGRIDETGGTDEYLPGFLR